MILFRTSAAAAVAASVVVATVTIAAAVDVWSFDFISIFSASPESNVTSS